MNPESKSSLLDFLVQNSNEIIFWTDLEGNFLGCNHAFCQMLGYSHEELVNMCVADIDSEITSDTHLAMLAALKEKGMVTVQAQTRRKDGALVTMEYDVTQVKIGDQVYLCTYARGIDLEKQLRNQVLKALATGMPLAGILSLIIKLAEKTRTGMIGSILLLDESGRFYHAGDNRLSPLFCQQVDGLRPGPHVGSFGTAAYFRRSILVEDISQSPYWQNYLKIAELGGVRSCWAEPIFSSRKKVLGVITVYFEHPKIPTKLDRELMKNYAHLAGIAIERARSNEAVQNSELRNRSLVESTAATIWTTTATGEFVEPQESWAAYTGQSFNEYRGFGWKDAIHPEDRERMFSDWMAVVADPQPFRSHGRLWHAETGNYRYFEVSATPIIRNDCLIEWFGCTSDVHDRKLAEIRFLQSQTILSQAQEVARLGCWVWNFDADQVTWSREFCRIHGYDANHQRGNFQSLISSVFVDDRNRIYQLIRDSLETGQALAMEYRVAHSDGSLKTVFSKTKFELNQQGERAGLIGTVLDVTDLRETEQALRKSERQLRTITDSLPVMIAYIDKDYCFRFNNAMYESRFDRPRSEIQGKHVRELMGEESFAQVKPHFDHALRGNLATYEQRIKIADNQSRITEVRLVPDISVDDKVIGVYALVDDVTERRALEKEVLKIAAEEQRRIGQDLHDGTGQELTGLGMLADTLFLSLSRQGAEEQEIARKLSSGIKRALGQVRALSRGLNPVDISSDGLMSALTEMADHVSELYGIECLFQFETNVRVKNNHVSTHLFRIAQEATTNAVKHGQATRIIIRLIQNPRDILLSIHDNGIGIDRCRHDSPGMGIRTMNYRAGLIGGRLTIAPDTESGTKIICQITRSEAKLAEPPTSIGSLTNSAALRNI